MQFNLSKSIEILERTPDVLNTLLQNLSEEWTSNNEGAETWSPYDIVGHLIHGETTDWIPRLEIILAQQPNKTFKPFNRFAQFEESKGKSLQQLLEEFKILRKQNLAILKSKNLTANDFSKTGTHPELGEVTLANLLATWTVHDLSHIAQITRVMTKQYKEATGAWINYLPILTK